MGTRVRSPQPAFRFGHGAESIEDLLQFTCATEMRLQSQRRITADAVLARRLHCEAGERWLALTMLRFARGDAAPIGLVHISCELASPEAAAKLGTAADAHGLQVTRRYRDARGRLTQVSIGFSKVQVQKQ